MREVLAGLFFDLLEVNIVSAVIILFLSFFAKKLRKRYGAGWMKIIWILLAVRLLIPYNFSIVPLAGISFAGPASSDIQNDEDSAVVHSVSDTDTDKSNISSAADDGSQQDVSVGIGQNMIAQNHASQINHGQPSKESAEDPAVQKTLTDQIFSGKKFSGGTGMRYTYVEILSAVWILGMFVCMFNAVAGYAMFLRKYQQSLCPVTDDRIREVISKAGLCIAVCQSRQITSPMLVGIVHPKLVIPSAQKQWTATELELVVEHELCHYRNRDLLSKLLMTIACCVNWINPAVYLMRKQFFYDIELACDEAALRGRDLEERELYARLMLFFAGNRTARDKSSVLSGSFLEDKIQLKGRIDNMFDQGIKKRGFVVAAVICIAFPVMGLVVSCGYQAEETVLSDINISESVLAESESGEKEPDTYSQNPLDPEERFDYNNEYNKIARIYKNDVYLARENGIYYIKDGMGDGELLYQDNYRLRRGMEIDRNFLYFCGSVPGGDEYEATIYRLNLDTHEIVDVLAEFGQKFESLYYISIYKGNLYAAYDNGSRIGFEMNQDGGIVRQLDENADDFLYRECNDYVEMQWKMYQDTEYDSEEYWILAKQLAQKYMPDMDVGACKKLLNGSQIVSKYKNEAERSFYVEKEDGTYEPLCDANYFSTIIAESGMYYKDERNRIWYVDFATRQSEVFYENPSRELYEIELVNYDAAYVYATQERNIGYMADGYGVTETYLIRIPRAGGGAQKVYRFENPTIPSRGLYNHCAVYDGRMYLEQQGSITLDPDANDMQRINNNEPCEDAIEMRRVVETFADAYFENDESVLRSFLSDDFTGTADLYSDPENAAQIRENNLAGLPDDNIENGVTCWLSYEFSGHVEADGAYAYLGMEVTKTPKGFRIKSYGLEQ